MANSNDLESSLARLFAMLDHIETISPDDIPDIELYMDQVTTFMDSRLRDTLRDPKNDKVLTKTMINNYAKNDLLPPPEKKKYSKDHLLELIFIFYFKNFLSINDIQTLLTPLTESMFGQTDSYGMEDVYREILQMGTGARGVLKVELEKRFEKAQGAFADAPEEQREYLRKFAYICELGYDIFLKKSIIEHMLDEMYADSEMIRMEREAAEEAEKANKKKKDKDSRAKEREVVKRMEKERS